MYARAVDDAGSRLRELRRAERSDLGVGAAAIASAVMATEVQPGFAVPLFLGGLVVVTRGLIAAWRRWDIVDELAGEPDASVIDEIRAHALRETTMERRRVFAASIQHVVRAEGADRLATAVSELEALAAELEDHRLVLEPACGVACARLVSDPSRSPLLDRSSNPADVRTQVRRIRGGFAPRDPT
jgi:hypothetical protein